MRLLNPTTSSTAPTPALIQSVSKGFTGGSALAYGSANTAGNFLVMALAATATGVTDTLGNTWVSTGTGLWYVASCLAGSNTVSPTVGGSNAVTIAEFSGISTRDVGGSGSDTSGSGSSSWTSNTITTTHAIEVIIGSISNGFDSLAVNSPYTILGTNEGYFIMFYNIVSSIQTSINATGTQLGNSGNTWGYQLDSFYMPSGTNAPNAILGGF